MFDMQEDISRLSWGTQPWKWFFTMGSERVYFYRRQSLTQEMTKMRGLEDL